MLLHDSGRSIFIVSIIMGVVSTLAVVLRFIGKLRMPTRFALEDWLMLASLLVFYGYIVVLLRGIVVAGGTLVMTEFTSPFQLMDLLKYLWATEILMTIILTTVKLSILLWYRSIFSVQTFRIPVYTVAALVVAWGLTALFIVIFQCTPIKAVWDLVAAATAKCFPFGKMILGYEVSNMILDIAILALPIRMIWNLRMNTQKKIMLGGMFSLGGFVCVTCILRIVYLYKPHDAQRVDLYRGMMWSTIELGVAIICGCLPTLRPMMPNLSSAFPSINKWYSSMRSRTRSTNPSSKGSTQLSKGVDVDVSGDSDSTRRLHMHNGKPGSHGHGAAPEYINMHQVPVGSARTRRDMV